MLRVLVVVLLAANLAVWAWQRGWWGTPPLADWQDGTREPERLAQQIEPERLRLLAADDARPARGEAPGLNESATPPAAAPAAEGVESAATPPATRGEPRACWQLAALPAAQAESLRQRSATAGLRGRDTELSTTLPERWIVYLGKFASTQALQQRRAALRQAGIEWREVNNPSLSPGLALGTYSTEEAANKALQDLQRQGVRDAQVVREREASRVVTLRWPDLTASEQAQLRTALGEAGRSLAPCP
jgi:hypothetical protein